MLYTGLLAGTLDILAAAIILSNYQIIPILKFIATGFFGKDSAMSDEVLASFGLLFHMIIAMCFTVAYFLVYPRFTIIQKNKWLSGIVYGIFVWVFMNYITLPLSQLGAAEITLASALKNMAILIVCVGIPIAFFADKHYKNTEVA